MMTNVEINSNNDNIFFLTTNSLDKDVLLSRKAAAFEKTVQTKATYTRYHGKQSV